MVEEIGIALPPLLQQGDEQWVERCVLSRGHPVCVQGEHIRVLGRNPGVEGAHPAHVIGGWLCQVGHEGLIAVCCQLQGSLHTGDTSLHLVRYMTSVHRWTSS